MEFEKSKPLVIRDELHGDMTFDYLLKSVIDHEYFQRLRFIKQLGLAEYVFPCATHTRYQHSLGAAYLANQYFENILSTWMAFPVSLKSANSETKFLCEKTLDSIREVENHKPSRAYWSQVVRLASLLHDIGHGPWSHSFEHLPLTQDFGTTVKEIKGPVGRYLVNQLEKKVPLSHEDISVLYIHRIFSDLQLRDILPNYEMFFLPVVSLVHKSLFSWEGRGDVSSALSDALTAFEIRGGVNFHKLLRPIVSGPFDVDRMDYIQRDGRNCGVQLGSIEWRRIVSKVLPCLAEHGGAENEPQDVVLFTSIKNQHVLDDFIFRLFQMYTQVYMHPKIVGLEEMIRRELLACRPLQEEFIVNLETHSKLSDEKLKDVFVNRFQITSIEDLLLRRTDGGFEVITQPLDEELNEDLMRNGFCLVEGLDRPMMKDSIGVFLYSNWGSVGMKKKDNEFAVYPWAKVSPIAQKFYSINYSPTFWLRPNSAEENGGG